MKIFKRYKYIFLAGLIVLATIGILTSFHKSKALSCPPPPPPDSYITTAGYQQDPSDPNCYFSIRLVGNVYCYSGTVVYGTTSIVIGERVCHRPDGSPNPGNNEICGECYLTRQGSGSSTYETDSGCVNQGLCNIRGTYDGSGFGSILGSTWFNTNCPCPGTPPPLPPPPSCAPSCSDCSKTCGGGTQTCTNPDCSQYSLPCNTQDCIPIGNISGSSCAITQKGATCDTGKLTWWTQYASSAYVKRDDGILISSNLNGTNVPVTLSATPNIFTLYNGDNNSPFSSVTLQATCNPIYSNYECRQSLSSCDNTSCGSIQLGSVACCAENSCTDETDCSLSISSCTSHSHTGECSVPMPLNCPCNTNYKEVAP